MPVVVATGRPLARAKIEYCMLNKPRGMQNTLEIAAKVACFGESVCLYLVRQLLVYAKHADNSIAENLFSLGCRRETYVSDLLAP